MNVSDSVDKPADVVPPSPTAVLSDSENAWILEMMDALIEDEDERPPAGSTATPPSPEQPTDIAAAAAAILAEVDTLTDTSTATTPASDASAARSAEPLLEFEPDAQLDSRAAAEPVPTRAAPIALVEFAARPAPFGATVAADTTPVADGADDDAVTAVQSAVATAAVATAMAAKAAAAGDAPAVKSSSPAADVGATDAPLPESASAADVEREMPRRRNFTSADVDIPRPRAMPRNILSPADFARQLSPEQTEFKRLRTLTIGGLLALGSVTAALFAVTWLLYSPAAETPQNLALITSLTTTAREVATLQQRMDAIEGHMGVLSASIEQTQVSTRQLLQMMPTLVASGKMPQPVTPPAALPAPLDPTVAAAPPAKPTPAVRITVPSVAGSAATMLVLDRLGFGVQLAAFQLERTARQFVATQPNLATDNMYFYRSGPRSQMHAVIYGVFLNNEDAMNALTKLEPQYNDAWLRRFEVGEKLLPYHAPAAPKR